MLYVNMYYILPTLKKVCAQITLGGNWKELEKMGKVKAVITQNIDNLHQDGGSRKVLELHGSLKRWYCLGCGKTSDKSFKCECGGIVRPDVTLYGEMLNEEVTSFNISP